MRVCVRYLGQANVVAGVLVLHVAQALELLDGHDRVFASGAV